jgi:hypothetical protein
VKSFSRRDQQYVSWLSGHLMLKNLEQTLLTSLKMRDWLGGHGCTLTAPTGWAPLVLGKDQAQMHQTHPHHKVAIRKHRDSKCSLGCKRCRMGFGKCCLSGESWNAYLKARGARYWWLTPVIPDTQEAEIRRIAVQSQPRPIVLETLSWRKPIQNRSSWVTQVVEHLLSETLSSNPSTAK